MNTIPACVILLQREHERAKNVAENIIPHYPACEIMDAIDCNTDQVEQIVAENVYQLDEEYFNRVERGRIACTLSHLKVLEDIVNKQRQIAIVFEDDMALLPNFSETVHKIAEKVISEMIEFIHLYVHPHFRKDSNHLLLPYYFCWGRCAYMITFDGAKKLIEKFKMIKLNGDMQIAKMAQEGEIEARMCGPIICHNVGQLQKTHKGEKLVSTIWQSSLYKEI